uniref:Uncharacterized protein n=1 Tax=Cajanus cajan TaxID=3821 RepID=A0A151RU03_CAJCA|nr:hypothetical protein KK1_032406 [Cajanus cajan]
MPLSVFKRLGMSKPQPTNISLQLADETISYLEGIMEDILVKIHNFIFPIDFVVLDMEDYKEVSIIFG